MTSDALVNGISGACGGIIAQLLTYPLQAANTRQQTERKLKKNLNILSLPQKESRNVLMEMYMILRNEGFEGLYRGLKPSLVGTACSQGVYYYFYQLLRSRAIRISNASRIANGNGKSNDENIGMLSSLIVAALAGCANVLITNPIWVVVTRMQTQNQYKIFKHIPTHSNKNERSINSAKAPSIFNDDDASTDTKESKLRDDTIVSIRNNVESENVVKKKHLGALETTMDLYREAGILGFWKGVLPTLIMVSNPSIQFMIYEYLLSSVTSKRAKGKGAKSASAAEIFTIGAIAKFGATVCTYPLLVVKSRLQAKQNFIKDSNMQYSGTLDAIGKMLKHEGIAGFYKGMETKIVQSVFASAVLFMIKEELVKLARYLVTKPTVLSIGSIKLKQEKQVM